MSQELTISITAKDGATQTFARVGSAARSMSSGISSSASQASGSLGKIDAAASKSASSMSRAGAGVKSFANDLGIINTKGASAGAALTTLVGALSDAGRAAAEEEIVFKRLEAAVEATGKSYDEYASQIDKAIEAGKQLSFADDKTAEALANLTTITGSADTALQDLALAQDLARAKGIDLATASTIVGKVAAGNTGILSRYGIVLEAGATSQEALAQMQTRFAGQAESYAATTAGALDRVRNAMDDQVESVGQWVNEHAQMITLLPGLSAGFSALGGVLGSLIGTIKESATAMAALEVATGPIGLALAAVGVAGAVVVHSFMEQNAATAAAEQSYTTLASAIDSVSDASARLALRNAQVTQSADTQGLTGQFDNLIATINGVSYAYDKNTISGQEAATINNLIADTATKAGDSVGDFATDALALKGALDNQAISVEDVTTILDAQNKAYAYNGANADEVRGRVNGLVDAWRQGNLTGATVAATVKEMTTDIGAYADSLTPAVAATHQLTAAQQAMAHASGVGFGASDFSVDEIRTAAKAAADAVPAIQEARQAASELANALLGELVPSMDGASAGFENMTAPGEDILDTLSRIAPEVSNAGGAFLQFADNLNDAVQSLDGVLGMFDAIDNIGSSANKAGDIASKLIGDPGTWSTIDDLVSNAAISQGTYNDAVAAGYDIQQRTAGIEEDLNAIRANQLPLLDSQVTKVSAYVDMLSHASAAEQQQALYLMDSANQAKVASAYSTAYAASLGEIPEGVATEIIAEASQADPVLADILERFGLIEVGADGSVRVNFEDKATLDDIVTSMDRLTETQIEIAIATSGGEEAQRITQATADQLAEIDGTTATATVDVKVTGLDAAMASGAGFGATMEEQAITVPVRADTAPAEADIASIHPAPIEVPVKIASLDTALASGAGFGASLGSENAVTVPIKADTGMFDTAIANLGTGKTVTIKVDADMSAFNAAMAGGSSGGARAQSPSVTIDIDANDNASNKISSVKSAAQNLDSLSVDVELTATDNASSGGITTAKANAEAFAASPYNATIDATDNASSGAIATAKASAEAFVASPYTATIDATDNASGPIGTAQGAADAFAHEYAATLTAVDNASGVIQSVLDQLNALDGKTVTTYVATEQISSLPAKALGGVVPMPTAALGRNVLVGEAGPEVATLPFGTFVKPHGADGGQKPKSLLPDVNMAEAYKKGSDSAKAFYKGLFDEAKSKLSDARGEINSTRYGSEGEAKDAIHDYLRMERQSDQIKDKIDRARDYDRRHREDVVRETAALADQTVSTMSAAGTEAGAEFSDNLAQSMDVGSVMDQVGKLKDEFISTMKSSAGSFDDTTSAVDSFNSEIQNLVGGLKGVGRSGDRALGEVGESFGAVESDAKDMGKTVGKELGAGVTEGAADAEDALGRVASMMGAVSSQAIDPNVGVDTKGAQSGIKDVSSQLSQLNSTQANPNVAVKVDDSAWQDFKSEIDNAQLGTTVTVKVKEKKSDSGGKQLGGAIASESLDREVPHAANGRIITVGETGEEAVILPYGAMVMPHDASRSRLRADAQTSGNMQFFAPVHIHASTPDVQAAIAAQMMSIQRD